MIKKNRTTKDVTFNLSNYGPKVNMEIVSNNRFSIYDYVRERLSVRKFCTLKLQTASCDKASKTYSDRNKR